MLNILLSHNVRENISVEYICWIFISKMGKMREHEFIGRKSISQDFPACCNPEVTTHVYSLNMVGYFAGNKMLLGQVIIEIVWWKY